MSDHTRTDSAAAASGDAASAEPGRLRLMAVHAHPDDETISMGGTLARYAATASPDTDAIVVTSTRGELGEIVIPERDRKSTRLNSSH